MAYTIGCRIASYGDYQDRAWTHLPEIGIRHIEMPVPEADQVESIRRKVADSGLTVTSLQARCDITQADAAEVMKPQLEACQSFGARICFLSVKAGDSDRAVVWDRLRAIGDRAKDGGVTVALETHPDLLMNADLALETMRSVDHPNVRVNFDTGNIYFYNHKHTAHGDLAKIIPYVAAVHLKDSSGGYQVWNFPELGTGVVDFPKVFALLREQRFNGPCTMELEGTKGVARSEAEQLAYIANSVQYLRATGAFQE
jgi:sugar phosphate isomerase/epimerase